MIFLLLILDIFNIVNDASERLNNVVLQIAYVDTNEEHNFESMKFAETVALNRGVFVRLFNQMDEAESWIKDSLKTNRA